MREALLQVRRQQTLEAQQGLSKRTIIKRFASSTLTLFRKTFTFQPSASDDPGGDQGEGGGGVEVGGVEPERILFVGWRRDMADMINSLDILVPPGSELWLFNTVPVQERVEKLRDAGNKGDLDVKNLKIKHAFGNPTMRRDILQIKSLDEFGDETGEVCVYIYVYVYVYLLSLSFFLSLYVLSLSLSLSHAHTHALAHTYTHTHTCTHR